MLRALGHLALALPWQAITESQARRHRATAVDRAGAGKGALRPFITARFEISSNRTVLRRQLLLGVRTFLAEVARLEDELNVPHEKRSDTIIDAERAENSGFADKGLWEHPAAATRKRPADGARRELRSRALASERQRRNLFFIDARRA